MRSRHLLAGAAWSGLALAAAAYAEARSPRLEEKYLPVLAPGSREIRILHLSDLHMTFASRWLVRFVRSLADVEADFVISTGDNFSTADGLASLMKAYEPLLDRPGGFVFGSNDYFSERLKNPMRYLRLNPRTHEPRLGQRNPDLPFEALAQFLEDGGWVDLTNDSATINLDSGGSRTARLALIGVDDPHIGFDHIPQLPESWLEADCRLGVTHAPYRRVLDDFTDLGAQVIFAGHTHGGQLCLPGIGALVTNCDLDRSQASGIFQWQRDQASSWVHVSRGLGTASATPFRTFCRPEASLLVLQPR